MKEETGKFLHKAFQSIEAAKSLLDGGYADFAGARAYYAMFYTAEALLCSKGLKFRKHGGVHSAFGEHFTKTGLLDAKFHRWLLEAFGKRIKGDYGVDEVLIRGDAEVLIRQAEEFLTEVRKLLSTGTRDSDATGE